MTLTPNEYAEAALAKEADQAELHDHRYVMGVRATRMQNGLNGLMDEVGELAAQVKGWLEYKRELDGVNLKEEVGDCLWRLAQICKAGGFTLEDAMVSNLAKLNVRWENKCVPHEESDRDREAERAALSADNEEGLQQPKTEDNN